MPKWRNQPEADKLVDNPPEADKLNSKSSLPTNVVGLPNKLVWKVWLTPGAK